MKECSLEDLEDPSFVPSGAFLQRLEDEASHKFAWPDKSYWAFARRYLRMEDWRDLVSCRRRRVHRKHITSLDKDTFYVPRCLNGLWCPNCVQVAEWHRRDYQRQRLASISPNGEAYAYRLVWTTPLFLRPLVRTVEGLEASSNAIRVTIAHCFGAKTKEARRRFWATHGALWNLHPFQSDHPDFPHWTPHWDGFVWGWRFKTKDSAEVVPTPKRWPKTWDITRAIYRIALRSEMKRALAMPHVARALGSSVTFALWNELQTNFSVVVNGRTSEGQERLPPELVRASIEYSSRAMWSPKDARLNQHHGDADELVYHPRGVNAAFRANASTAARELYAFKEYLSGTKARRWMGVLNGNAYTRACKRLSVKPIGENRRDPDSIHKGMYLKDPHTGTYDPDCGYFPVLRSSARLAGGER